MHTADRQILTCFKQKQKRQYIGGRGRGQFKGGNTKNYEFERLRTAGVHGILVSCDIRVGACRESSCLALTTSILKAENLCRQECIMAFTEFAEKRYPKAHEAMEVQE
eukprot:767320-Hanusia_phi.AAC.14